MKLFAVAQASAQSATLYAMMPVTSPEMRLVLLVQLKTDLSQAVTWPEVGQTRGRREMDWGVGGVKDGL